MKILATALFCALVLFFSPGSNAAETGVVAVIGTGDMGDSLGPRFAELGYRVVYGSRNPDSDKVKALVAKTGGNASATTQMAAAQQGDIVLTLVPWPAMETVAQSLGNLDGKIVIDQPAELNEVAAYLQEFPQIDFQRVLMMPQGVDEETLQARAEWLKPACVEHGWTFCPRRQIEWFGAVRRT